LPESVTSSCHETFAVVRKQQQVCMSATLFRNKALTILQ